MESVIHGAVVYLFLLLVFRITGKRSLAQITTFDAVLLLIIAEATQQAMLGNDNSMTNAFIVILTLMGLDVLFSLLSVRSTKVDQLLNDAPLILVENGQLFQDRMKKERVSEDDILEHARGLMGVERLDQIKYAILERNGAISIVPKQVPWAVSEPVDRASVPS